MSTDSGTAEQSNETKFFNLTTTEISNIFNIISVFASFSITILQYLASKPSSSFYGINSELFHSQPSWSTIIDFFAPALVNLAILLTPFIVADYYRNSLKTIKEGSNNKEKTLNLLYPPLVILIFCYALLFGCYILYQYAAFFDLINKESNFITICIFLSLVVILILLFMEIYIAISKTQQAEKDKSWCLGKEILSIVLFILSNGILWYQLYPIMGENIWLLLILYNFFIAYFLATLLFFLDENTLFFCIFLGFYTITFIYTIALPLSSGKTYYSGKKQYEIVEPISSSNIASGSNLKVVILHKDNQLLLMDFTTDESTKDGSAPSKENEKQTNQSIEEILSKASESNLNIKKGEYTIQDENLYKFYTVTFKYVKCE